MSTEIAYRATASGEVDQARLEDLRRRLTLHKSGRLSDEEDEQFGYRVDLVGGIKIRLTLSRAGRNSWSFWVSYDDAQVPDAAVIDGYRTEIRATIEAAGLTFEHEYRKGPAPAKPGNAVDPQRQRRMLALHKLQREWEEKYEIDDAEYTVGGATGDNRRSPTLEQVWEFERKAREILGQDPETGRYLG